MLTVVNTKLGESRGVPRVWLEGRKLGLAAFQPGQSLSVTFDKASKKVCLKIAANDEDGQFSVSQRSKYGRVDPLIEIRSDELRDVFGDVGVLLRVVIKDGTAVIEAHGFSIRTEERAQRLKAKLDNGEPLAIGSLFSGGGVIDAAIHDGLQRAGVSSYSKFVVEREFGYIDAMVRNQPDLFRADSVVVESDIAHVEFKRPPLVEILIAGIPCTGASRAGKTKNAIALAEEHSDAGACFFHFLNFAAQVKPAIIVVENVQDYMSSAGYAVIKSVLSTWGYRLSDAILNGVEFGGLEARDRMCLVATTDGLDQSVFDFSDVKPVTEKPSTLSEVLEDVADDDPSWKSYSYLAEKEVKDKAAGKGFKRTLVTGCEASVPTLRRLYHKGGSCDTFVAHPDGVRSRLFTPKEHARIKGVPARIIAGVSDTTAHEILGQGVVYPVFVAVGCALARFLAGRANETKAKLTVAA